MRNDDCRETHNVRNHLILLGIVLLGLACSARAGEPAHGKDGPATPAPQRKRALLIAVDDYARINDLTYCGSDMTTFQERLLAAGFAANEVLLLSSNAAQPQFKPLKEHIQRELGAILGAAGSGDLVLAAFSGHGVHLDGVSYLCPVEADLDAPQRSMISLEDVYARLIACKARQKLLLVDACRNDPRPGGQRAVARPTTALDGFSRSLESPPEGILVLTSCRPGQLAVEDPSLGHGVFMHFILQGLEGEADRDPDGNRDGRVSLLELYHYASVKTKAHVAADRNLVQTPMLRGELVGDWDLAPVLPRRPGRLPARFYQRSSVDLISGLRFPDLVDTQHPQVRLALERAREWVDEAYYDHQAGLSAPRAACRKAIAACNEAMDQEPQNPAAYLLRAVARRLQGDFPEAMEDFRKLQMPMRLRVATGDTTRDFKLTDGGKVTGWFGCYDDLEVTKVEGEWLYVDFVVRSSISREKGREARGWIHQRYFRSLSVHPQLAVWNVLDQERNYLRAEDPQALAALRRARDSILRSTKKYDIGRTPIAKADCDEAVAACDEAIRREPDNELGYLLRGIAHWAVGDLRKALIDFQPIDMALPLRVRDRPNEEVTLKVGEKPAGKIRSGDTLLVTKIDGDWLWVEEVDRPGGTSKQENESLQGWISRQQVE